MYLSTKHWNVSKVSSSGIRMVALGTAHDFLLGGGGSGTLVFSEESDIALNLQNHTPRQ